MTDFNAVSDPDELIRLQKIAELERTRAEISRFAAEERKLEAETEAEITRNAKELVYLEREASKLKRELALNDYHLFYAFNGEVGSESVQKCITQLTIWMRNNPGEPIEVQFNSPGGSVVDGMALFDFLQTVRAAGHYLTTSTIGYAASMAGILLQAGDERVMGKYSSLLIHEITFGAYGKMGEMEDRTDWLKAIWEEVLDILAERSNLTKTQLKKMSARKDCWILSKEALAKGLVDKVR